jgi:hypothetical protein
MALFQAQADMYFQPPYLSYTYIYAECFRSAGFNNPPVINQLPFEEQMSNLEEYWDSEAPRMGGLVHSGKARADAKTRAS